MLLFLMKALLKQYYQKGYGFILNYPILSSFSHNIFSLNEAKVSLSVFKTKFIFVKLLICL